MRKWLESKNFYWWSLQINFFPLPWHWVKEYEDHPEWFKLIFGPVGIFIVKP